MTQHEAFGRRLRQLRREKSAREERDVEQTEVAEAVGDTQPNVARWERGRIPKADDTIRRLAAYYGVTMLWLRYGEGPRERVEPETPVVEPPKRTTYYGKERTNGAASERPAKKVSGAKRRPSR